MPNVIVSLTFIAVFLFIFGAASIVIKRRQLSRELEWFIQTESVSEDSLEPGIVKTQNIKLCTRIEKYIEASHELSRLKKLVDQSGVQISAYKILIYSIVIAIVAAGATLMLTPLWWITAMTTLAAAIGPTLILLWVRARRITNVDRQLPDAIDMVKRSLRAGNPLVSTFRVVSRSMTDPIAREFGITAADLSYGNDPRNALLAMLERVPSIALRGFVTAILVQRESGGNLAEALDHISSVIRQRFRFDRKLKTLSAEGRLSAWILVAIPFGLAAVLHLTAPSYLAQLLDDPRGPTLVTGGALLMTIGLFWIRRISRIVI